MHNITQKYLVQKPVVASIVDCDAAEILDEQGPCAIGVARPQWDATGRASGRDRCSAAQDTGLGDGSAPTETVAYDATADEEWLVGEHKRLEDEAWLAAEAALIGADRARQRRPDARRRGARRGRRTRRVTRTAGTTTGATDPPPLEAGPPPPSRTGESRLDAIASILARALARGRRP